MQRAHALETPADWLLRSQHHRGLPAGGKLWTKVRSGEALGEIEFLLPARGTQAARLVRQKLFACRVEFSDGRVQSEVRLAPVRGGGRWHSALDKWPEVR